MTETPSNVPEDVWLRALGMAREWVSYPLNPGDEIGIATTIARAMVDTGKSDAARDVLAERERQKSIEGWTPEHDDAHANGEIAGAAACYALTGISHWARDQAPATFWPWDKSWWKPTTPRRDLVKAGALILAEIERLDRASPPKLQQRTDR